MRLGRGLWKGVLRVQGEGGGRAGTIEGGWGGGGAGGQRWDGGRARIRRASEAPPSLSPAPGAACSLHGIGHGGVRAFTAARRLLIDSVLNRSSQKPRGPVFISDLCRVTNSQAAAVRRRAVHQLTSQVLSTPNTGTNVASPADKDV